jgi:hypothetical protein
MKKLVSEEKVELDHHQYIQHKPPECGHVGMGLKRLIGFVVHHNSPHLASNERFTQHDVRK